MASERLETLMKARERLVQDRHEIASALAKPFERGETELFRKTFVEIQAAIEAVNMAIEDEEELEQSVYDSRGPLIG